MRRTFMFLFIGISVLMPYSQAFAITWIDIPVVNSGAEIGDMTGWSYTGPMAVDQYEPQSMQPIYPHTGNWFFSAAQPAGTLATMAQNVDVSGFSVAIDSGLLLYDFGFWYQNENWDNAWDTGEGKITFYDNVMNELSDYSTYEIANDAWTSAGHQDCVPLNTRTIKLKFIGRRHSGSHINAFFDDVYLKVGVIPGPATLSLLGLGSLALAFKKKRIA